jgi:starvation-inducible outer membrane lipoprotein
MARRRTFYLFGIVCILLAAACTKGISKQARSQVTYSGGFSELQEKPGDHAGEVVILGGKIIETQVKPEYSEITVLQLPLGGGDSPRIEDQSKGRFLIHSLPHEIQLPYQARIFHESPATELRPRLSSWGSGFLAAILY